ncbi:MULTISPECIES: hypothetical protein [Levilactobacillus]|nr:MULTISPECIES: hypothetical protein [Levilactobacillus]
MKIWHKKRALTWPSELEDKKYLSYFFSVNSTPKGGVWQWL